MSDYGFGLVRYECVKEGKAPQIKVNSKFRSSNDCGYLIFKNVKLWQNLLIFAKVLHHFLSALNKKLKSHTNHYFKEKKELTKKELAEAISSDFPHWSQATINIRISQLKKEGVIKSPSRGVYIVGTKNSYQPHLAPILKKLHNKLLKEFPFATFCVWDTKWLHEFMRHQPFRHYLVVEVEKEVAESAFNSISTLSNKVFLDPDEYMFARYISNFDEPIIVKKLISEAPVEKLEKVTIPALEKLLIDMLTDENLFAAQQGEIDFIYHLAFEKYTLNKQKMKRYAERRNRASEFNKLLSKTLANYI